MIGKDRQNYERSMDRVCRSLPCEFRVRRPVIGAGLPGPTIAPTTNARISMAGEVMACSNGGGVLDRSSWSHSTAVLSVVARETAPPASALPLTLSKVVSDAICSVKYPVGQQPTRIGVGPARRAQCTGPDLVVSWRAPVCTAMGHWRRKQTRSQ